jgi:endonuclease YncB( thermonuclease family)
MRFLSFRKPRSARVRSRYGPARQWLFVLLLFAVCAMLAARLDKLGTQTLAGGAIIQDGDTLTIRGERIRLSGIDAFELDQTCSRSGVNYACGQEARATLVRLVGARVITCEWTRRDRYQRILAVCSAGDTDLNREMVSAGWAVSYGGYRTNEITARLNGRGAWEGDFVAPSDWRASNGRPVEERHDIVSRFVTAIGQYLFE